jgi:hypothetical protein
MTKGLPIISTDIQHGPAEILNPEKIFLYSNDWVPQEKKYGLLVDYGCNPKSKEVGYYDTYIVGQLVEKILVLINNESLYQHYSNQSLIRARDFSEDKILKEWIGLIKLSCE